jgi:ATP-binding cassette subfamily F protein 3
MADLSANIAELDAALAVPGLFARDPQRAAAMARARAEKASALKHIEDDWLAASAAFEAAMA